MRQLFILVTCLMGIATAVGAQQANSLEASPLAALNSMNEGAEWDAVGRLHMGQSSFCTASLITEDLVLTAAHCLFEKHSGQRIADSDLQFQAGVRLGRAAAYRNVRRSVVYEGYDYGSLSDANRVAADLALIELDKPIRTKTIKPFYQMSRANPGDAVQVVSYAVERERAPSLQKLCHVLGAMKASQVLSCDVDYGASGAPIFLMKNGEPTIVAVVSAGAKMDGKSVALVAPVADKLVLMQAELAASDGVFRRPVAKVRRLSRDEDAASTGAKFLKP